MTDKQKLFIEEVAGYVRKYAPMYNVLVHSPIIAQAIIESNWGTSNKVINNGKYMHNYLGLKWRDDGRCPIATGWFTETGSEQDANTGQYVSGEMRWCKFNSLEDCVHGYFQWTNISRYSKAKGVRDPETYIQALKDASYATSISYVNTIMNKIRELDLTRFDTVDEEEVVVQRTNSALVDCKVMSPNHSGERTQKLTRITPHCVVGQLSAESIGGCFDDTSRQASCNYGIGKDGRVCLIVDEKNRSWCSSNNDNDQRAITIECASDKTAPYALNDAVYKKLIDLCVDICKRYSKTKLLWFGDKTKTLNYAPADNEMVLTVHRWFANKSCPGDWLYSRLGEVATEVTKKLGTGEIKEEPKAETPSAPQNTKVLYNVQVGAYSKKEKANEQLKAVQAKGFNAFVNQIDGLYKVQVGAYSIKANADDMLAKVKAAGFNAFVATSSSTEAASIYYPKYEGNSKQIDVVFQSIGVPAKFIGNAMKRKPIATANGINNNYTGKAADNLLLISLAKAGKLKKV